LNGGRIAVESYFVTSCATVTAAAEAEPAEELDEHPDQAYVTLATNDVYAVGAMVLAYSLRATCTTRQLVAMVTPDVSPAMRDVMREFFDVLFDVSPIDSNDSDNLSLLNRPVVVIAHTRRDSAPDSIVVCGETNVTSASVYNVL